MGGCTFTSVCHARTAKDAFECLQDEARNDPDYDEEGYNGDISGKSSFRMVYPNPGETPTGCIDRILEDEDHFSYDKWGPAACIDAGPTKDAPEAAGLRTFIFFGWASS